MKVNSSESKYGTNDSSYYAYDYVYQSNCTDTLCILDENGLSLFWLVGFLFIVVCMLAWTFQYLNDWPNRMHRKFDPNVKIALIERSILSTRRFSNFACRLSRLSSKANVLNPSKRRESDATGLNYSTRDTIKSNSFSSSKAAFL